MDEHGQDGKSPSGGGDGAGDRVIEELVNAWVNVLNLTSQLPADKQDEFHEFLETSTRAAQVRAGVAISRLSFLLDIRSATIDDHVNFVAAYGQKKSKGSLPPTAAKKLTKALGKLRNGGDIVEITGPRKIKELIDRSEYIGLAYYKYMHNIRWSTTDGLPVLEAEDWDIEAPSYAMRSSLLRRFVAGLKPKKNLPANFSFPIRVFGRGDEAGREWIVHQRTDTGVAIDQFDEQEFPTELRRSSHFQFVKENARPIGPADRLGGDTYAIYFCVVFDPSIPSKYNPVAYVGKAVNGIIDRWWSNGVNHAGCISEYVKIALNRTALHWPPGLLVDQVIAAVFANGGAEAVMKNVFLFDFASFDTIKEMEDKEGELRIDETLDLQDMRCGLNRQ